MSNTGVTENAILEIEAKMMEMDIFEEGERFKAADLRACQLNREISGEDRKRWAEIDEAINELSDASIDAGFVNGFRAAIEILGTAAGSAEIRNDADLRRAYIGALIRRVDDNLLTYLYPCIMALIDPDNAA